MEYVIFEKRFAPPICAAEYPGIFAANRWCFELHRAEHLRAHVAVDGHKTVCVFRAPDAESVRTSARTGGLDFEFTWPANRMTPPPEVNAPRPPDRAPLHVVERSFAAPVSFESIQEIEDRGAWCLEAHRVRFAYTYFSFDRRRMLCMYEAPDAESVRRAQAQAGLPFDRVWPATLYLEPGEPA
jgi:hypothetical protein